MGQGVELRVEVWRRAKAGVRLELVFHKGCDFFGQCNCFPRLLFVGIYEVFQRIAYSCAVPAQSLGRQFQLAESRVILRAFLCEIEQIMD